MTCPTGHCVTCADEGIPMRVLGADAGEVVGEAGGAGEVAAEGTVRCRAEDGTEREVDASLVEPVAPGDLLLVHAGVALARLPISATPTPRTEATEGGAPP